MSYLVRQLTLKPVDLPFRPDALQPILSAKSVVAHYHQYVAYCEKARKLLAEVNGPVDRYLDEIVRWAAVHDEDAIFNQAAQAWNHAFLWLSLRGRRGRYDFEEPGAFEGTQFGHMAMAAGMSGLEDVKQALSDTVVATFGSGWVWLVKRDDNLRIIVTKDAETPIVDPEVVPLLVIDCWEHAYLMDYGFDRARYAKEIVKILDWDFAMLRATQHDEE